MSAEYMLHVSHLFDQSLYLDLIVCIRYQFSVK